MNLRFDADLEGQNIVQNCDGRIRVISLEAAQIIRDDWGSIVARNTKSNPTLADIASRIISDLNIAITIANDRRNNGNV